MRAVINGRRESEVAVLKFDPAQTASDCAVSRLGVEILADIFTTRKRKVQRLSFSNAGMTMIILPSFVHF